MTKKMHLKIVIAMAIITVLNLVWTGLCLKWNTPYYACLNAHVTGVSATVLFYQLKFFKS